MTSASCILQGLIHPKRLLSHTAARQVRSVTVVTRAVPVTELEVHAPKVKEVRQADTECAMLAVRGGTQALT